MLKAKCSSFGHSFYSSLHCSIITYKNGFRAGPGLWQRCVCVMLKRANGAQQPCSPGMRAAHSDTMLCHEDTKRAAALTLVTLHMRILCVVFVLTVSFKGPSCGQYQRFHAYFTQSVYFLAPTLICSATTKCVCLLFVLCAFERGLCAHKSMCMQHVFASLYFCICVRVHVQHHCAHTVPFCLTWQLSPPAVRLLVLPSTGLSLGPAAQQEWLRRTWHIFSEVSFHTLLGAVWLWLGACGQGSMPGGEVRGLDVDPSLESGCTGKFQLSRTQLVPNKRRVFQPPSCTEKLTKWAVRLKCMKRKSDYSQGE